MLGGGGLAHCVLCCAGLSAPGIIICGKPPICGMPWPGLDAARPLLAPAMWFVNSVQPLPPLPVHPQRPPPCQPPPFCWYTMPWLYPPPANVWCMGIVGFWIGGTWNFGGVGVQHAVGGGLNDIVTICWYIAVWLAAS